MKTIAAPGAIRFNLRIAQAGATGHSPVLADLAARVAQRADAQDRDLAQRGVDAGLRQQRSPQREEAERRLGRMRKDAVQVERGPRAQQPAERAADSCQVEIRESGHGCVLRAKAALRKNRLNSARSAREVDSSTPRRTSRAYAP
jgi:hypothetical protein